MMEMEYIPGMIVCLNHMMQQWAWEDFAEFENLKLSQAIVTPTIKFMCLTSCYYYVQVINN